MTIPANFQTVVPGVLSVVTYAGFEPVCWYNPNESSEIQGRDIVFLRRFAESLGLRLEVKVHLFDHIWERPARGEADIAAAGIAPLPERDHPGIVWTQPYFRVQRSADSLPQSRYSASTLTTLPAAASP